MARLFRRIGEEANGGRRLWVELMVTQADILRYGMLVGRPGLMLFTGMWYGSDPTDHRSYGKMIPVQNAVPVGQVSRRSPASTIKRLK